MPNIYEIVTDQIIEQLEKGVIPWKKDWTGAAVSHSTGKEYRGINALLLKRAGEYLTFKQITEQGGTLHKGAKSEIVVFYKAVNYGGVEGEDGELIGGHTFMKPIRYYRVFNIADIDGIAPKWTREKSTIAPLEQAETLKNEYIQRAGIGFRELEQNGAYYTPATDCVTMPKMDQFGSQTGYYGTLFHEFTHSSGAAKRLNRVGLTDPAARFGNEIYGREELVAEIGAAMLYSLCGLGSTDAISNSAAYIKSWTKAIKDDPKMIVKAANEAQRAADYIRDVTPAQAAKPADETEAEAPAQSAPDSPEEVTPATKKPAKKTTKKTAIPEHSNVYYSLCLRREADKPMTKVFVAQKNARKLENKYGLDLFTLKSQIIEARTGLMICHKGELENFIQNCGKEFEARVAKAIEIDGLSPRYTRPNETKAEVFPREAKAA